MAATLGPTIVNTVRHVPRRTFGDVLKILITDALVRVNRMQHPNYNRVGKVSNRVREWHKEIRRCQKWIARYTKLLAREGLAVQTYGNHSLYRNSSREQTKWNVQQAQRKEAIARLRARAAVELIDLSPTAAKRYLRRLEQRLAKI